MELSTGAGALSCVRCVLTFEWIDASGSSAANRLRDPLAGMSLADEIEAQLATSLRVIAEAVKADPGTEVGLAWGENGHGRIVIPLNVVAKLAADVARRIQREEAGSAGDHARALREAWLEGFAAGIQQER